MARKCTMYRVCKDSITYLSSLIQVSKSRLLSLIDWVHVASCYFPFVWGAIILYLASQTLLSGLRHKEVFEAMLSANEPALHVNRAAAVEVGWWFVALILILALWLSKRSKPVYLLDFACFEPPESWRLSPEQLMFIMKAQGCFNEDSLAFWNDCSINLVVDPRRPGLRASCNVLKVSLKTGQSKPPARRPKSLCLIASDVFWIKLVLALEISIFLLSTAPCSALLLHCARW